MRDAETILMGSSYIRYMRISPLGGNSCGNSGHMARDGRDNGHRDGGFRVLVWISGIPSADEEAEPDWYGLMLR